MKYPNAASTGAWLSSGGWKVSHPGLVVSEGSAVFSSLGAAGLTCEHRACRFDGCLRASCVVGGTGRWHTSYFSGKVWGRNEDWCGKTPWQPVGPSIHILSFRRTWHLRACLYIYMFTCMGRIRGISVCVCGGVIIDMWYNCIWSPNKHRISPSPWWRWQMWWTSALAARTTLDLLKIIDLLFASQVGDK